MDKISYILAEIRGPQDNSKTNFAQLMIDKVSYDGSGNVEYVGYAPQGSATSAAKWRIAKLAYDGSSRYTGMTLSAADQVWDDRATTVTYS